MQWFLCGFIWVWRLIATTAIKMKINHISGWCNSFCNYRNIETLWTYKENIPLIFITSWKFIMSCEINKIHYVISIIEQWLLPNGRAIKESKSLICINSWIFSIELYMWRHSCVHRTKFNLVIETIKCETIKELEAWSTYLSFLFWQKSTSCVIMLWRKLDTVDKNFFS